MKCMHVVFCANPAIAPVSNLCEGCYVGLIAKGPQYMPPTVDSVGHMQSSLSSGFNRWTGFTTAESPAPTWEWDKPQQSASKNLPERYVEKDGKIVDLFKHQPVQKASTIFDRPAGSVILVSPVPTHIPEGVVTGKNGKLVPDCWHPVNISVAGALANPVSLNQTNDEGEDVSLDDVQPLQSLTQVPPTEPPSVPVELIADEGWLTLLHRYKLIAEFDMLHPNDSGSTRNARIANFIRRNTGDYRFSIAGTGTLMKEVIEQRVRRLLSKTTEHHVRQLRADPAAAFAVLYKVQKAHEHLSGLNLVDSEACGESPIFSIKVYGYGGEQHEPTIQN